MESINNSKPKKCSCIWCNVKPIKPNEIKIEDEKSIEVKSILYSV
jgi:hypothetical protein